MGFVNPILAYFLMNWKDVALNRISSTLHNTNKSLVQIRITFCCCCKFVLPLPPKNYWWVPGNIQCSYIACSQFWPLCMSSLYIQFSCMQVEHIISKPNRQIILVVFYFPFFSDHLHLGLLSIWANFASWKKDKRNLKQTHFYLQIIVNKCAKWPINSTPPKPDPNPIVQTAAYACQFANSIKWLRVHLSGDFP